MSSVNFRNHIVVGVLSALDYNARRNQCRQTWFNTLRQRIGILAVFLIGCPNLLKPLVVDDKLLLPCPDDYINLPQKTLHFVSWAVHNLDFDYLFKCDDDTYVHPHRLAEFHLDGKDYMGADVGGYASGGAGYFLSRRAARIVAQKALFLTGAEDLLVGETLRENNIRLTADTRFEPFRGLHQVPSTKNLLVTAHPIRESHMQEIHAAITAEEAKTYPYEVINYHVSWGILGVNGARGFGVENELDDEFDRSDTIASWDEYNTLSAHAPSEIILRVKEPISVFGCADGAALARSRDRDEIQFFIDGANFFAWRTKSERSREVRLDPGEHVLKTSVSENTRAYSVWVIRKIQSTGMRIVMPTSNEYVEIASRSLQMLENNWPDHPPVDVVHYDRSIPTHLPVNQIYVGHQNEVTWIEGLARYLEKHNSDELLLLLLDDYGLCAPVQAGKIIRAQSLMLKDPSLASFYLTWMMLPSSTQYRNEADILIYPPWMYSCHTQAGIWRRLSLLRNLMHVRRGSAAEFEVIGSDYFNRYETAFEYHIGYNLPEPANPSLFLDSTDKTNWPVPYHNLMRAGCLDVRHQDFCRAIE